MPCSAKRAQQCQDASVIPLHPLLQEEEQGEEEGGPSLCPVASRVGLRCPRCIQRSCFPGHLGHPAHLPPLTWVGCGYSLYSAQWNSAGGPTAVCGLQACRRQKHQEVLVFACACVCASAPVSKAVPSGLFRAGTLASVTQTEEPRAASSRCTLWGALCAAGCR